MQLVISVILLAHGVGHILFAANSWGYWKADAGRAPLFEDVLHVSQKLEGIVGLLWIIPLVGFAASAWGVYNAAAWWPAALLLSSVISAMLVVAWWKGVTPSTALYALIVDIVAIAFLIWQSSQGFSLG